MSTEEMVIAEYSTTTAELAKLKVGLAGKVYEVANVTGMAQARFDRRGLVTLRTTLEATRKTIKAPALAHCKLIDDEAKRITLELRALEDPIDAQIGAQEAIEKAKWAEKLRLAAEAQAVLDNKILEIAKLPLTCMGQNSDEISLFLAALEARPFGGEFVGETLLRAEAAKLEAVMTIRDLLAGTIAIEEAAVLKKAEEKAEAERIEAAQMEVDRLAAIENKRLADERAVNDEQKRLNDIESARLAELAATEQKRLDDERAVFEAEQAEARKVAEDAAKRAADATAAINAEAKRIADIEEAKGREKEQQDLIIAETARKKADIERKASEKALKLSAAKCADAATAFKKILAIAQDNTRNETQALAEIAVLAEANI